MQSKTVFFFYPNSSFSAPLCVCYRPECCNAETRMRNSNTNCNATPSNAQNTTQNRMSGSVTLSHIVVRNIFAVRLFIVHNVVVSVCWNRRTLLTFWFSSHARTTAIASQSFCTVCLQYVNSRRRRRHQRCLNSIKELIDRAPISEYLQNYWTHKENRAAIQTCIVVFFFHRFK